MARLTDEAREERLHKLMTLCYLRGKGTASEDQIAQEMGFVDDDGSPLIESMYERLGSWGLPDWVVHPDEAGGQKKRRRKARVTGNAERLPPAGRAVDLFRQDLERLAYFLNELPKLKEDLQAERFVSSSWVGEDWEYLHKDDYLKVREDGSVSDERWIALCERHAEDPSEDVIRVQIDPVVPQGARPTPWEGLVPLIAVHALLHEPDYGEDDRSIEGAVDVLLDRLHPDPPSVDKAELYKKRGVVDFLKTSADNLAKTLRGGRVRSGQHPGAVSDLDHWVAWYLVSPRAEKGHSDEQIHAWMERKHPSLAELYAVGDIARLRELSLPLPDREPPE